MVTQKLVTEEAWYALTQWYPHIAIFSVEWSIKEQPKHMAAIIKSQYPDATPEQIRKALLSVRETIKKKSGYEFE